VSPDGEHDGEHVRAGLRVVRSRPISPLNGAEDREVVGELIECAALAFQWNQQCVGWCWRRGLTISSRVGTSIPVTLLAVCPTRRAKVSVFAFQSRWSEENRAPQQPDGADSNCGGVSAKVGASTVSEWTARRY